MDMKTVTIGKLIDNAHALREKKRVLDAELKELSKEIEFAQEEILARLAAEGAKSASSKKATASVSFTTVAAVNDWDAFWAFLLKRKYTHMLQRRVSDPAYRELLELAQTDKKLAKELAEAGIEPFVKTTLNLRSI